ncbi:GLPGLI family protein [Flavobacterium sp. K5-23]|uniref:GLPGLI family protein n=1 Tax=Flavobacterium sp. K5-23 TaxID=2746225 RepID=UPI00200EC617|nr:GLPGLI family protein [Flavobacterium sp. K5-23]UQD55331.1 GLPGLI family protein [Flavobacterium sp. K5-23]
MKNVFIALLFSNFLAAQQSIKVTYEQVTIYHDNFFNNFQEHERETIKKIFTTPQQFELINNGDYSTYESLKVKDKTILSNIPTTDEDINQGTIVKIPKTYILKNYSNNKSYTKTEIDEKEYYTERPFPEDEFIFTSDEKVIDNYKCKLAYQLPKLKPTDTIKYWYTQEIPVFDGPYYTAKIPGLVIRYERKQRVIYATKIEFFDKKIILDKLDRKIPLISDIEYEKIKEEDLKPKNYTDENGAVHTREARVYKGN